MVTSINFMLKVIFNVSWSFYFILFYSILIQILIYSIGFRLQILLFLYFHISSCIRLQVLMFLILLMSLDLFGLLVSTLINRFIPFFSVEILVIFNDVKLLWKKTLFCFHFIWQMKLSLFLGTYAFSGVIAFFEPSSFSGNVVPMLFKGYLFIILDWLVNLLLFLWW